jgi:hypothetical protein
MAGDLKEIDRKEVDLKEIDPKRTDLKQAFAAAQGSGPDRVPEAGFGISLAGGRQAEQSRGISWEALNDFRLLFAFRQQESTRTHKKIQPSRRLCWACVGQEPENFPEARSLAALGV